MSIRYKALIIVGGTLLFLIVILVVAAQLIMIDGFKQLENEDAHDNVQRAVNAINDEITSGLAINADWAWWDDTYEFIQDSNEVYIEDNLAGDTLGVLNLNVMIFVNTDGEIVFSKAIDLETWEETTFPEGINELLSLDSPLVAHPDETSGVGGIILLPDGLMLVTSRAILTNESEGPIQGALIFGRFLDESAVQALSESLKLDIALWPLDDQLDSDLQTTRAELANISDVFVKPIDDKSIAGYGLLGGIDGNPAVLLRVNMNRDIVEQGQSTFSFFALSLVIVGLTGGIVTLMILDRMILSRISRLVVEVGNISTSGDLSYRIATKGTDEISTLGNKLNEMLVALGQAQVARQESDKRLQTLVNNAPIVIWAIDTDGKLTLVDGDEINNLNIDPAQLIGRPISDWINKIPMTEEEIQQTLKGEIVSATNKIADLSFDAHFVPLKDEQGKVTGVIGVATNISDRILAEQGLKQAGDDLNLKNQQLLRAHELLRSTVEQLSDTIQRGGSNEELKGSVDFIQQEFLKLQG
jgi:PAS domain S-box-containing protein